ncbi:3,4-dihydroxy-2-butanone-4-phosphate synthase [Roseospirillum parvum]|uniref:3,4-dihydroxy-2-butanone 4-phosphate synthase n=1 Tax=Roseospirillum parvum TaxID=83401 RepID=A0A1G7Y5R1_9PROT|nr:3,4-dihydroxy-2-butanone-4-phosphate synthase [Roseospirillum parvum]SDG91707.1 3,4-dihydroxy 2-butanone 4-phosphate synthase / GTP cyclohydrolase II [Roseospirillum parvum]
MAEPLSVSRASPAEVAAHAGFGEYLSSVEEIIEDARNGRMFILVDDEDRENEGDLVIPAQMATPEAINFMARFGRGLICLALTPKRCHELELPLMPQHNQSRLSTAFTISIEAREGVTTGISASDRARTIAVAIDPDKQRRDLATPGHVFPLMAREGGVLARAGHTEAAVDVARMAGLNPAGVICEIMNDDGSMARMPDLVRFAQHHGLKIATIADLIAHRRRTETLVSRELETAFRSTHGGDWRMMIYTNTVQHAEHIALVKGDPTEGPAMVRVHAVNVLDDVLGACDGDGPCGTDLRGAMQAIAEHGRGAVVLIREPSPTALSDRIRAQLAGEGEGPKLIDYGVGAQILLDLGVRDMILLTNHAKHIIGLEGYGLTVVEQRPIGRMA